MKKVLSFVMGAVVFLPALAFAAAGDQLTTSGLTNFVTDATNTVNALVPFFLAIAVVVFIYGIIRYVIAGSGEEKAGARNYIIYGIIGIAVILSLFAIAKFLPSFFGITGDNTLQNGDIPTIGATGAQL